MVEVAVGTEGTQRISANKSKCCTACKKDKENKNPDKSKGSRTGCGGSGGSAAEVVGSTKDSQLVPKSTFRARRKLVESNLTSDLRDLMYLETLIPNEVSATVVTS